MAEIAQDKLPCIEASVRKDTLPSTRANSHILLNAAAFLIGSRNDRSVESTIRPNYSIV
jgi:hypothetical protein